MNHDKITDPEHFNINTPSEAEEYKINTMYYLYTNGKLKKVEREEPQRHQYEAGQTDIYLTHLNIFKEYVSSLPEISVHPDLQKIWKEGSSPVEGKDFQIMDTDKWYWCKCENPKCGWEGSSMFCGGGMQIADTGDYSDARCPHCCCHDLDGGYTIDVPEYSGIMAIPIPADTGKERCPYELFVIKYFGLPEDVSFNAVPRTTYADIVSILCMFAEEKSKTGKEESQQAELELIYNNANALDFRGWIIETQKHFHITRK